jgi:heterodisulfide reductase subunit A
MMDAGRHPNIELLDYSEVVDVHGYVGNFDVRVRRKPRYVRVDLCTGCGLCVDVCVLKGGKGRLMVPSEFEAGLDKRGAAYIPFAQAVPLKAVIDPLSCLWLTKGKCSQKCVEVCERQAIDFEMEEELVELKVGTIVVATGFDLYDAGVMPQYGYGRYPDVLDGLQFERMTSNSGPTGGQIITAAGHTPEAIAFLHCIGSRDAEHKPYCSRVCCMYAMKQAHLAHELSGAEVYEFYIDIRSPGKGYEEFYEHNQREGIHFIRGKVAEVEQENGRLLVRAEDTLRNRVVEVPVDMVVLMTAMQPSAGSTELGQLLGISRDKDGWFAEAHPKLRPVHSNTDGIFLAGCAQFPKDIPDTVAQASGAASQVVRLLNQGEVSIDPTVAEVIEERCSGCSECVLVCPYSAIEMVTSEQTGRNHAWINPTLCKGCGTCAGACLAKAIRANHFTDEELVAEVIGVLVEEVVW